MTSSDIRDAILASPELLDLAHAHNLQAVATSLSGTQTKLVPTEVGNGTILEVLGLIVGNALLDVINTSPDFRYVKPLVEQGRLRLDAPLTIAALQSMVPAVLTQEQADSLLARAQVPDTVTAWDVSSAIYNDNGTLRI